MIAQYPFSYAHSHMVAALPPKLFLFPLTIFEATC